jgi:hypothetical protein
LPPGAAAATPFVDLAVFTSVSAPRTFAGGGAPAGVVFLCDGVAATTCGVTLRAISRPAADYTYSATQTRTVTVENLTGTVQDSLYTVNDASAGYGYPGRGVGVDDPSTQSASFSAATDSSLQFVGLYDQRTCATSATNPVCATSPWDSTGLYDGALGALAPGQSLTFTIGASLTAALRDPAAIPEPATAALVGARLAGLVGLRRAVTRRRARGARPAPDAPS